MKQNASSGADSSSVSLEIPHLVYKIQKF